jgi:hypothetical protein
MFFHFSTIFEFSLFVALKLSIEREGAGFLPIPYYFVIVPNFFMERTAYDYF